MAHDAHVVHDPLDDLSVAALAPDRVNPKSSVLRVEPTPANGKTQLAQDLLAALRCRPKLAFRWSDGGLGDYEAAGIWCHAHGIRNIVVPRAHALDVKRVRELAMNASQHTRYDELLTWWFIDGSEDGSLVRNRDALHASKIRPDEMRREIADTEEHRHVRGAHIVERPPTTVQHAIRDAHPTLFARHLLNTVPGQDRDAVHGRFISTRDIMRSTDRFRSWQSALWYCLRASRDAGDALLILRAAQLAMLERRVHLTMQSSPWEAAGAARQHVTEHSSKLLAYVDPLIASIGALALQTGFSARTLTTVTGQDVTFRTVPSLEGFDAGQMDDWIAAPIAAQVLVADRDKSLKPLLMRLRHTGHRTTGPPDKRESLVTEDRITAVLGALATEREIDFDHQSWGDGLGLQMVSV